MCRKLRICLPTALIFAFIVPLAFAGTTERKSEIIPVSSVVPAAGAEVEPPRVVTKHPAMVVNGERGCGDISPQAGTIIQDDQIGSTWYEYQQNGSMGQMIAVGPCAHRHTIFHETRGPYGSAYPRWVAYNCKDPLNNWLGPTRIDGGSGINAGYANIGVLHDAREVVIYHTTAETPRAASVLKVADEGGTCSGYFPNRYDLPDWLQATEQGMWPKMGIVYDPVIDTDYIHIVVTEGKTIDGNQRLGYIRCHLLDDENPVTADTLLCETPTGQFGVISPVKVSPNVVGCGTSCPIAYFGEVEAPGVPPDEYPNTISAVVATSLVSQKVAIVFTNKRVVGTNQVNNDVFYFESTNNGQDWFPQFGGTWPPTLANGKLHNITNYPTNGTERGLYRCSGLL